MSNCDCVWAVPKEYPTLLVEVSHVGIRAEGWIDLRLFFCRSNFFVSELLLGARADPGLRSRGYCILSQTETNLQKGLRRLLSFLQGLDEVSCNFWMKGTKGLGLQGRGPTDAV